MIDFISRNDDDFKVQNLINITCYEVFSKLSNVDERQIFHIMFIRDINDEKTSSDLIKFFFERRINYLSIKKTLFSSTKSNFYSTKSNEKTEHLLIFFQSAKKTSHFSFVLKAFLQLIITLLLMCHQHNK